MADLRAHERRKRSVPVKRSVRDRWFLPAKTPFLGIPLPVLFDVVMPLRLEESRVLLAILADWWWPGGHEREVNVAIVARRTGMDVKSARRGLAGLHDREVVEVVSHGKGRSPVVRIARLIELGRRAASKEGADCPYHKGRRGKKGQSAPTKGQIAPTSRGNGEPGEAPSEPFSSDSSRPASEVGGGYFRPSSNGRTKTKDDIHAELKPFLHAEEKAREAQLALNRFREETP